MSSEHYMDDDLRPEYDLKKLMRAGVRGKYADRYRAGPVSLPGASESEEQAESFELTAEQEAELEAAIAEIERGNYVTPEQIFEQLRRDHEGTSPLL